MKRSEAKKFIKSLVTLRISAINEQTIDINAINEVKF